jgi:HK97 family phage portal protein
LGLLASLFRADDQAGFNTAPDSDFWYTPIGLESATGLRVTPDTAMRLSAVFGCVRVAAETMASMPLVVRRKLPDGGTELAEQHPLYELLHDKPNYWQTSFEWIEMMQGHLELRGNAYSLIQPGPNGAVDQLIPLHPDRVIAKRLQNGRLVYDVRQLDGTSITYTQDEILHLRGWTSDGINGMSPITIVREAVGTGLAAQDYGARFFKNDAKPGGILEHPGKLTEQAARRLRESFQEAQTGSNRHKTALLEEGMKYHELGIKNTDAQFLETRKFSRNEICAIYRIPPHMIGDLERATHSNIEHQGIEFVMYSMLPRVKRWEGILTRDLLSPLNDLYEDQFEIAFLMDGLLRGDMKSRYDAYKQGRDGGWLSINDVRRKENMNPIDNGDDYLQPLNMTKAGSPGPDPTQDTGSTDGETT